MQIAQAAILLCNIIIIQQQKTQTIKTIKTGLTWTHRQLKGIRFNCNAIQYIQAKAATCNF